MRNRYNDTGIIIKTADYGESDKIISIISLEHGLVHYFAVGARSARSKKSAHLDLASIIKYEASNNHNQNYLVQADTINSFQGIKDNLKKISLTFSFLEIVYHLLPAEQEDKEMFDSLKNFLTSLDLSHSPLNDKKMASKFGQYLLRHLGYPPVPHEKISLSDYFETLMNRKIISKEIL